jgi:DNA processing protein
MNAENQMELQYLLQLQAARGVGASAQRAILRHITSSKISLSTLFASPASEWYNVGITNTQLESIYNAVSTAKEWQEKLEQSDVKTISLLDSSYPKRLSSVLNGQAPPILYYKGNFELLQRPAVGFCGSRETSGRGLEVAEDTVKQVAERNWTIVSGHAKGIDLKAHKTALLSDSSTIIVVPEGIFGFRLRPELKELASKENTLIISEFQPNTRWSVANAMIRNHTLCGLSDALVVVQAGLSGGTFEAGNFALRVKLPLFVADYSKPDVNGPGNPYLIQKGAKPIRKSPETGKANLGQMFSEIESHYTSLDNLRRETVKQETLFPVDDEFL